MSGGQQAPRIPRGTYLYRDRRETERRMKGREAEMILQLSILSEESKRGIGAAHGCSTHARHKIEKLGVLLGGGGLQRCSYACYARKIRKREKNRTQREECRAESPRDGFETLHERVAFGQGAIATRLWMEDGTEVSRSVSIWTLWTTKQFDEQYGRDNYVVVENCPQWCAVELEWWLVSYQ